MRTFEYHGDPTLRVLSLGGGMQSSALALMAAGGELPLPDHAVFADTGNEPPSTYAMIDWLADNVPFPVHRVKAEIDILTALRNATDSAGHPVGDGIPVFTINRDGTRGQNARWCTDHWKRKPIERKVRQLLGIERGRRVPKGVWVEQQIGISVDEYRRMRDSGEYWRKNAYPLVDARLSRNDCQVWWTANAPSSAPPLARSACVICPFHSDREWLDMQDQYPGHDRRCG